MTPDELRALQAPLKTRYREDPSAAVVTLRAVATALEQVAKLLELTERHCVVYQTLVKSPPVILTRRTT